ncbi:MAG: sulfite exporter TauE/SafE family protein [Sulfuricellaceae bacterium]
MELTVVGLPMAVALGLVFGMGPCIVSCFPYLGPVFLASDGGIRHSWRILLPLSLGRLTGYGGFGLAAGLAGQLVGDHIGASSVRLVLGCATVMVGLALLLRRQPAACGAPRPVEQPLHRLDGPARARTLMPGGLFLLGLGMALTPCTPLGAVLFSAAASASWPAGLALGLGFGLGAVAVPSLVYGVGVAYFGSRLRTQLQNHRVGIERLSAALLIVVGLTHIFR